MKDTAPVSQGIIAVAALVAIIGAGVAFVLYDFSLFASAVIGGVVGLIAAVVLALGWREPAPRAGENAPTPAAAPKTGIASATSTAPAVTAAPAPAETPAATPEPDVKAEPETTAEGTPEFLSEAREGGPDDLKQIKGVGPKLEKTLHGMGIYHFDQIASWGPKEQAWMDENLEGFKGRATRDEWVPQAKTLAAGGTTEFSKKVDKGDVY